MVGHYRWKCSPASLLLSPIPGKVIKYHITLMRNHIILIIYQYYIMRVNEVKCHDPITDYKTFSISGNADNFTGRGDVISRSHQ